MADALRPLHTRGGGAVTFFTRCAHQAFSRRLSGMVQSFTPVDDQSLPKIDPRKRRRVLVTGAAGNIGSYFAEHSHDRYDLRLMVRLQEKKEKVDAISGF